TGESASDIFSPNSNPDSLPLTEEGVDDLNPTRPDRAILEPEADLIDGSSTISGTYNMGGSASDPTIWIFDGSTKTDGDVVFTGNGIIYVDGNLTIETGDTFSTTGTIALYVQNDMTVRDDMVLDGLIYAGNNFKVQSGSLTLNGPLTARNDMTFEGPVTVGKSTPPSPFYTPLGYEATEGGGAGTCPGGGAYTLNRTSANEGPITE
ncbi:MAG: hypothetical protein HKN13_04910, partial [Rhodothermales bacterium]|nr:hypothetical protein [Rhodothermales bacterium]